MGSVVVPFCGLYLGSYKVIPKRNYYRAYGYALRHTENPENPKPFAPGLGNGYAKRTS